MPDFLIIVFGITFIITFALIFIRLFIFKQPNTNSILHLIEDKKLEDAIVFVTLKLKKDPHNTVLLYWLGELYWLTDKFTSSIEIFENIDIKKLNGYPNYKAQMFFRRGTYYRDRGLLIEAEKAFNELELTKVEKPEYYYGKALLAIKQTNPHFAIQLLKKALTINNDLDYVLKLLGDVLSALKFYPEAFDVYSRLIFLNPNEPAIWLKLGRTAFELGDTKKAIKFYHKAEVFPNYQLRFSACLGLIDIFKETGDIFQETEALSRAIDCAKPEFCPTEQLLELHYDLAELYIVTSETDKAMTEWEKILSIEPKYKDVAQKHAEFSHLRFFDFFKDLLTLNGAQLVETILSFLKHTNVSIDTYSVTDDLVEVTTLEHLGKWRDSKNIKTLFCFWCSLDPLPLGIVENLRFAQNSKDAYKSVIVSAGPVLSETRSIIAKRSIDLYTTENIQSLISSLEKPKEVRFG